VTIFTLRIFTDAICERDDPLTSTCQRDNARTIKLDLHSEKETTGDTMRTRTCQRGQKRSNFLMRIGVYDST